MSSSPESQQPGQPSVSQEAITGSYELHVALFMRDGTEYEDALQQVVALHQQSPEAFEWYAGEIDAYRADCLRRSTQNQDDFTHNWVARLTEQPSKLLYELERWRTRQRQLAGTITPEQKREIEEVFIDDAVSQYIDFTSQLLTARGVPAEQTLFVSSMHRVFQPEGFTDKCLDFAMYRSEIIDRMMRHGDTLEAATEAWDEWVTDDPETVRDCLTDWLWSEQLQLNQ